MNINKHMLYGIRIKALADFLTCCPVNTNTVLELNRLIKLGDKSSISTSTSSGSLGGDLDILKPPKDPPICIRSVSGNLPNVRTSMLQYLILPTTSGG